MTEFNAKVENYLRKLLPDQEIKPGIVYSVLKDNKVLAEGAIGLAHLNYGIKLDSNTRIRIGSQTKQFAILLLLLLEEEGKLSMNDPVSKHLDYFPHDESITLSHLAHNVSGVRDHIEMMFLLGVSIYEPTTRDFAREIMSQQDDLNFETGTEIIYSNAGFFMLGDVIEKVTGNSFTEVLTVRILAPLNMNDTGMQAIDGQVIPNLAGHYCADKDGWISRNWGFDIGSEGAMYSTLEDMKIWARNLDNPQIGTKEMIDRMSTPWTYPNGATGLYGMGLVSAVYRGRRAIGHGGGVSGGRSETVRFVDDGLTIILIANTETIGPSTAARRIADLYFEDPEPARTPISEGRYRQVGGKDVFGIIKSGDQLLFQSISGNATLDYGSSTGIKPERSVVDMTLFPNDNGTIDATYCGQKRQYVRCPDKPISNFALDGIYKNVTQNMEIHFIGGHKETKFTLRSKFGIFNGAAVPLDHDLWQINFPPQADQTETPAFANMFVSERYIEINLDRVKRLRFDKL